MTAAFRNINRIMSGMEQDLPLRHNDSLPGCTLGNLQPTIYHLSDVAR